jgi:hypothetical protein
MKFGLGLSIALLAMRSRSRLRVLTLPIGGVETALTIEIEGTITILAI